MIKIADREELNEHQFIVYEPPLMPEENETESKRQMDLFCENLPLILAHSDIIIDAPEYFHIRHDWSIIGGAHVDSPYIPLGGLLLLWRENKWIGKCPDCGRSAYIFTAGGSPLSGRHLVVIIKGFIPLTG